MTAAEAREIISDTEKYLWHTPSPEFCRGYLAALKGEEVRALMRAGNRMKEWIIEATRKDVDMPSSAGLVDWDETLARYRASLGGTQTEGKK